MYYLVMIVNYNDETARKSSLYAYESQSEAVAYFHSQMGAYMKGANTASVMCAILDQYGNKLKSEAYFAPVTEEAAE